MPISRVRRSVACETTAYNPIPAISNAAAANDPNTVPNTT